MTVPLSGVRRRVADLGLASVPPVFVVWGKQRDPLRRYGSGLIMVREGLFDDDEAQLTELVTRALADPKIGTDWEPDRRQPGYYEPKRKK
jgi:hypothetical protein